jgi:activating signal cointegrator complex subunit 3
MCTPPPLLSYVRAVRLVVIDEIHLLGADRGPILEVIVSRMRYISAVTGFPIRIVGLSTALSNARDLAEWLGITDPSGRVADSPGLFNFHPSVRPVPLEAHIAGFEGPHYCPRMATMNRPCFLAIRTHSPAKPVLIFVSSRRQTRLTALDLIASAAGDDDPRMFSSLGTDDDVLATVLHGVRDPNLRHTLPFGIGIHHAGLARSDMALVESLFLEKKIQVVVATSTLAWGVNLPAHLVIVKGTEFFDGKTCRYVDYPITDVLQMMGRAGRPQHDDSGKAVILVEASKKEFYKRFLYEPFPVESSLHNALDEHLNAEIAGGSVADLQGAVDYLTWTFLYRRLSKNPSAYGAGDGGPADVAAFLSRLVEGSLSRLRGSNCIEINAEDGSIAATDLGTVASYYYVSHKTVRLFERSLGKCDSLGGVLAVLARATEYEELPVRHNEDIENAGLAVHVAAAADALEAELFGGAKDADNKGAADGYRRAVPPPNATLHTASAKTELLLQAHILRVDLPSSDYATDLASVLSQLPRLVMTLIDIAANSGRAGPAEEAMRAMACVVQAVWTVPALQLVLPGGTAAARGLRAMGAGTIAEVVKLGAPALRKALPQALARSGGGSGRGKKKGKERDSGGGNGGDAAKDSTPSSSSSSSSSSLASGVARAVHVMPHVAASAVVERDDLGQRAIVVTCRRRSAPPARVHAPRYPRSKDESWWCHATDQSGVRLLALRRCRMPAGQSTVRLALPETTADVADDQIIVRVSCDSYVGLNTSARVAPKSA